MATSDQLNPLQLNFTGGSPLGEVGLPGGQTILGSQVTLAPFQMVSDLSIRVQIQNLRNSCHTYSAAGRAYDRNAFIDTNQELVLPFYLRAGGATPEEAENWRVMSDAAFFHFLERQANNDSSGRDVVNECGKLQIECDPNDLAKNAGLQLMKGLSRVLQKTQGGAYLSAEQDNAVLRLWMQGAFKNNPHPRMAERLKAIMLQKSYETTKEFCNELLTAHCKLQECFREAQTVGYTYYAKGQNYTSLNPKGTGTNKRKREDQIQPIASKKSSISDSRYAEMPEHTECGHRHAVGQCRNDERANPHFFKAPFSVTKC